MIRRFIKTAAAALSAATLLLPAGCQKETPDNGQTGGNGGQTTVPSEVCGTYSFGKETHDILTATCDENDYYYTFTFSPQAPDSESLTTFIIFGLQKYFADGETHDVNDNMNPLGNNGEYIFVYEDPVWYYSMYRDFQQGTFRVTPKGVDSFSVSLDVNLIDGTPFTLEYDGEFRSSQS